MSVKIGVLVSGGGSNLQKIIDGVSSGQIRGSVDLVISSNPSAYGLTRAKNHKIPSLVIDPKDYKDPKAYNKAMIDSLKESDIELVVLAGFLRVLDRSFIKEFENRIINIHPSLIPSFCGQGYYGDRVHKAVKDKGVKLTGASCHFVDEGTDTGPIIMQKSVEISHQDQVEDIRNKVLEIEHEILVKSIGLYCENRLEVKDGLVIIK